MKLVDRLRFFRKKDVVDKNIEIMESNKMGGMMHALMNESIGGNAGEYEGHACAAANFYFNRETGEITCFSNYPEDANGNESGCFRVVVALYEEMRSGKSKTLFFRIIQFVTRNKCSKIARKNIELAVAVYNEKFKLKE